MKITLTQSHRSLRRFRQRGLTLIEVSLVIALLLGLIAVLFFGIGAYREGADKARCRMQVSQMQKAMRAYANVNNLSVGGAATVANVLDLGSNPSPDCPDPDGNYTIATTVPAIGTIYAVCSIVDHRFPTTETATW
jgi:prepilin-type N-terminal cleavage/methylation domain-containing protein